MSKKTAFITGITGQDGAYLAQFLLEKKYQVIGLTHSSERQRMWRLDYLGIHDRIKIISGSLLNNKFIKKILSEYQPREIYNLAGESNVAKSWEHPQDTFLINSFVVAQLLENIRVYAPTTRLFQASSAEIYGNSLQPATEEINSFSPLNPYATSKLAAHFLIRNYREQYNLFLSNGVLFTHTSPLQIDSAFVKNIVRGVAKIFLGQTDCIIIGDIRMQRDFSFAGDVVGAMWLILQPKQPRDFIISSGITRTVEEFVELAFECVGIKKWRRYIRKNPELIGKRSLRKMSGSNEALKKIGWKPKVSLDQLVNMMMDFELKNTKKDFIL